MIDIKSKHIHTCKQSCSLGRLYFVERSINLIEEHTCIHTWPLLKCLIVLVPLGTNWGHSNNFILFLPQVYFGLLHRGYNNYVNNMAASQVSQTFLLGKHPH